MDISGKPATWLGSFRFSEKQRLELMRAWGGDHRSQSPKRAEKVDAFIRAVEGEIALWLNEKDSSSRPAQRDALNQLKTHTRALLASFRGLPADIMEPLDSEIQACLLLDRIALRHDLTKITGTEYPGLGELWPLLSKMLSVLDLAAAELEGQIPVHRGRDTLDVKFLVSLLAQTYQAHFGKTPSISDGGNFCRFLDKLKSCLGIEIGENTIRAVLTSHRSITHFR